MQRDVKLICGQTGSGKSYYAQGVVAKLPRALVFDAGFREFSNTIYFDDLEKMFSEMERRNLEADKDARFNFGYTPLHDEYNLMFEGALALGNLTIVLEEADRFNEKELPDYEEIIARGRHYGVSILAIAPHPFNFPKDLRRQLTEVISFRQVEESDLKYLEDVTGPEIYQVRDFPRPPDAFKFLRWTSQDGVKING